MCVGAQLTLLHVEKSKIYYDKLESGIFKVERKWINNKMTFNSNNKEKYFNSTYTGG